MVGNRTVRIVLRSLLGRSAVTRRAVPLEVLLTDYEHIADGTLGQQAIAERLGMDVAVMLRRLRRQGVTPRWSNAERQALERIKRIAARGGSLQSFDLPFSLIDQGDGATWIVLRWAEREGLIERNGRVRSPIGRSRVRRYVSAQLCDAA